MEKTMLLTLSLIVGCLLAASGALVLPNNITTDLTYYSPYRADTVNYEQFDLYADGIKGDLLTSIVFQTKGKNDAHILLKQDRTDFTSNVIEIVLGGWNNTKSVIRDRQQGSPKSEYNDHVLSESTYRYFWVSWSDGYIKVGKGSLVNVDTIMSWSGLSHSINDISISYGNGSDGYWILPIPEAPVWPINTTSGLTYYSPYRSGRVKYEQYDLYADGIRADLLTSIVFQTKGKQSAFILLKQDRTDFISNVTEILLGGLGNTKSVIRDCQQGSTKATYKGQVLSGSTYRYFWMSWSDSYIKVGKGSLVNVDTIMSWSGLSHSITDISISYGYGSDGYWILPNPVTKYGQCPVLTNTIGICVENCANDGDCTGDQKCCSNGCGHVCMNPAVPTEAPVLPNNTNADLTYYSPYRPNTVNYEQFDLYADGIKGDLLTSIVFQTKGKNDAHILLKQDRIDFTSNVIEIVLGGWGNTKSVIRDRQQGSPKSEYNDQILSESTYRYFWVSWSDGYIKVGKGSLVNVDTIMSWSGLSHSITDISISYGYGSDGYWILPNPVTKYGQCPVLTNTIGICVENCANDVDCTGDQKCCSNGCGHVCMNPAVPTEAPVLPNNTNADLTYYSPYRPNTVNYEQFDLYADGIKGDLLTSIVFQTKGENDAHILLKQDRTDFTSNVIEIVLGGWGNTKSVIRDHQQGSPKSEYNGQILSESTYRYFWVSWSDGFIKVGKGSLVNVDTIMSWSGLSHSITDISISYGYGSDGYWILPNPATGPCTYKGMGYLSGSSFKDDCNTCWCNNGVVGCTKMLCDVTKYGQCPVLTNATGICVENCANDGDCTGDQKCCSNGCGHVCMNPAVPTEAPVLPNNTNADLTYYSPYRPNTVNYEQFDLYADGIKGDLLTSIVFQTKGKNDAHMLLKQDRTDFTSNVIEIVLGGWGNTKSVIRDRQQGSPKSEYNDHVLSESTYRYFWVSWSDGYIKVGKGSLVNVDTIMSWSGLSHSITDISISYGYGSDGYWILPNPVTKYGQCPLMTNAIGICVEYCANDGDCTGDQKCCSNGCGHVCMNPAVPTEAPVLPNNTNADLTYYSPYRPNTVNYEQFDLYADGIKGDLLTSIVFQTKGKNDAHILLKQDRTDFTSNVIEIVLGGWDNTKSVIRDRQQGSPKSEYNDHILSESTYRYFWVSWSDGYIKVGKGSLVNVDTIMSWSGLSHSITDISISYGYGSDGYWILPNPVTKYGQCPVMTNAIGLCVEYCANDGDCTGDQKCCSNGCGHVCMNSAVPTEAPVLPNNTNANLTYYSPSRPNTVNYEQFDLYADGIKGDLLTSIVFQTKGKNDAHILLKQDRTDFTSNVIEIVLGGWDNTKSVIRDRQQGSPKSEYNDHILSESTYRYFWVSWSDGYIKVGKGSLVNVDTIMSWSGLSHSITDISISYGYGSDGYWIFPNPGTGPCTYKGMGYLSGSSFKDDCNTCWCNNGVVGCTKMLCDVTKYGQCPVLTNATGICVENCANDGDCTGDQKCCSNGCGHVCMNPAVPTEAPVLPNNTNADLTYYSPYRPNTVNYEQFDLYADGIKGDLLTSIVFQTKGKNDAHILLKQDRTDFTSNVIEIVLGGWGNTKSVIRDRQQGSPKSEYNDHILSESTYRYFWVSWSDGYIKVGKGSLVNNDTIMSWSGLSHSITDISISYGYGSDGYWIFPNPATGPCTYKGMGYLSGTSFKDDCNICWCNTGVVSCTEKLCADAPTNTTADLTYYSPYRPNTVNYQQFDLYADGIKGDSLTSIIFATKGENDAHILLKQDRTDYMSNVIEIVLGGWGNTKSVIRDRQQGSPKAQYNSHILSASTYRYFWVSWSDGCIKVGKGSLVNVDTKMSWHGFSHSITDISISYGYGSDGYWKLPNPDAPVWPINTTADLTYYSPYRAHITNYQLFDLYADDIRADNFTSIVFQTKGRNDAHLLLKQDRTNFTSNIIEIVLGGLGNTKSVIRDRQQCSAKSRYHGQILSESTYRYFWVSWSDGCIKVGKGSLVSVDTKMSWCGLSHSITDISISYGYGSDGYWIFPK